MAIEEAVPLQANSVPLNEAAPPLLLNPIHSHPRPPSLAPLPLYPFDSNVPRTP
jgi:hypothetical protein